MNSSAPQQGPFRTSSAIRVGKWLHMRPSAATALPLPVLYRTLLVLLIACAAPAMPQNLHKAAEAGELQAVKQLVAAGENVNAKNSEGQTPLHKAIWGGHFDVARYLVDNGSDVNAGAKDGATPLMYACQAGTIVVQMAPLSSAASVQRPTPTSSEGASSPYDGQLAIVKYLVEKGAKVDSITDDGVTALHNAVDNGYVEIAGYVLTRGADANAKTKADGATPLLLAAKGGYVESAKLLLRNGAMVDAPSPRGTTPLMLAAAYDHFSVVKVLLDSGASVEATNKDGKTALNVTSDERIVELLKRASKTK